MNTRMYILMAILITLAAILGYAVGRRGLGVPCMLEPVISDEVTIVEEPME